MRELYCQRNHELGLKQAFEYQNKFWAPKFISNIWALKAMQPPRRAYFPTNITEVAKEEQRRNFQTVEQGPMKNNGQESFSQEADLGIILEAFFTPRVGFSGSLPIRI